MTPLAGAPIQVRRVEPGEYRHLSILANLHPQLAFELGYHTRLQTRRATQAHWTEITSHSAQSPTTDVFFAFSGALLIGLLSVRAEQGTIIIGEPWVSKAHHSHDASSLLQLAAAQWLSDSVLSTTST
jgi:hypothetical protein